jgi:hypothetical protein
MTLIEELIDQIKFRSTGLGQAPNYDYKTFFYEVLDIVNDPKWIESKSNEPPHVPTHITK